MTIISDPCIANIELIEQIIWPCHLPTELKYQLLSIAKRRKGIHFLNFTQEYQRLSGVIYILSGVTGLSFTTKNIDNSFGLILGRSDWLGTLTIGNDIRVLSILEEVEEIELLVFSEEEVLKLATENTQVYKWLFYAGQHTQKLWMQAMLTSIHDKQQKVIYFILELAVRKVTMIGSHTKINITQNQLGSIIGISRPRLNEVLKNIERRGAIFIERGTIHITNIDILRAELHSMSLMFRDPIDSYFR